jgi:DNA modification methylase
MADVSVIDQTINDEWAIWNSDCIEATRGMPDASVHFSMFSPPFISLYTFSDDPRDVSNNRSDQVFWDHYKFVLEGVYRLLKPGRMVAIHCMDLPTSITRDGFIGMRDFPGHNLSLCEKIGFIFHSRIIIWKDPVVAMQRTKSIGLLHKQVVKDSALSRMGICDQIIVMRKPGHNDEPVSGIFETLCDDEVTDEDLTLEALRTHNGSGTRTMPEHKSIMIWQRFASPVWMDIAQNDTLSFRVAREEHDERHISPLQLTPIRRCLELWTNPGDTVFSPFTGIGSVGYVAIGMDRKFVGAELKASYYRQACANLRLAEREKNAGTLFDQRDEPEPAKATVGLFD